MRIRSDVCKICDVPLVKKVRRKDECQSYYEDVRGIWESLFDDEYVVECYCPECGLMYKSGFDD